MFIEERDLNMRITESRLRRVIRQVIREAAEDAGYYDGYDMPHGFDKEGYFEVAKGIYISVEDPVTYREDPRAAAEGMDNLPSIHDAGKLDNPLTSAEIAAHYRSGTAHIPARRR